MLVATPGTSTYRFASQTHVTREWTSPQETSVFTKKAREEDVEERRAFSQFMTHETRQSPYKSSVRVCVLYRENP